MGTRAVRLGGAIRERTERNYWKGGAFQGQIITQHKGTSQDSTRITPAKIPSNSRYIALTGYLL